MKKRNFFVQYLLITFGVICIALGYYFFFLPKDLVTGGVSGIAIICNRLWGEKGFSPSILIYTLNAILLIVGWIFLGKDFFVKTIYASLLFPTITTVLELCHVSPALLFEIDNAYFGTTFSELSQVIFAVTVGGLLTAIGLGVCFRNNATTGGMDVVQKMIAKFFHFPYSKTVYITDGIVVLISIFVFGVEKTFYAILCIVLIGVVVDYISMGGKPRRTIFIISKKQDLIKERIIQDLERGVTVVPSFGGYSGESYSMLVCTLSKLESYKMRDIIAEIDPSAFTFYVSAKEVYGDGFE